MIPRARHAEARRGGVITAPWGVWGARAPQYNYTIDYPYVTPIIILLFYYNVLWATRSNEWVNTDQFEVLCSHFCEFAGGFLLIAHPHII